MTNQDQKNNLEKLTKTSYTNKNNYLEMFKQLFYGVENKAYSQKNFSENSSNRNSFKDHRSSFYTLSI